MRPADSALARLAWRVALYVGALGLFLIAFAGREPYDDSHIIARVALNAVEHGALAWNPDEGPVFGTTSQAFQLVAVAVAWVTEAYFAAAIRLLSALALVAAFAALARVTWARDRAMCAAYVAVAPVPLLHVLSGMETAFAILSIALLVAALFGEAAGRRRWLTAPLLAVLAVLVRPDAGLLAVPLVLAERWRRAGRAPWREALVMAALLGLALACCRLYYGTALPLPFYAKQAALTPYDDHFLSLARRAGLDRFGLFAACAGPLAALALLRRDARNLILVACAAAFVGYHVLSTVDVMGMHGRFYAPAMPVLALAAARSITARPTRRALAIAAGASLAAIVGLRALGWFPAEVGLTVDGVPAGSAWLLAAVALSLFVAAGVPGGPAVVGPALIVAPAVAALVAWPRQLELPSDDAYLARQTSHVTVYRGLDTLRACFGDAIHVYHSEVGLPGRRFRRGKVTDLAGLLSPARVFGTTTFDAGCQADRPDAIFLPHRNYRDLNREIRASACLRGYDEVVRRSNSPLFVRRDRVEAYRACARARRDRHVVP